MTTLGIIGAGHLAGFVVEGLARAGRPYAVVLSPRNAATATRLARDFGALVGGSNQEVADKADIVIASVLPHQAEAALSPVRFRQGQLVISVMAGVPHGCVAKLVRPAGAVVAMMPGHANALGAGPSCLYPSEPRARKLLAHLGPVFDFAEEERYAAAAAFGGFSGMTFGWMDHVARWFEGRGIEAVTARRLVAATIKGNAEVLLAEAGDAASIIEGVATPGGITELGNRTLEEAGGHGGWDRALDAIAHRIGGGAGG